MQKIIDWLKCVGAKIFPVLDTNKDGVLDKKDFQYLEKKTKDELEALGRKIGIELDKRQTKAKLIAALKKAGKERSKEELDRTRVQSLFTQGRMQFAADDARFAGQLARQQALVSAASSIATMGYRMQQVTPTSD